MEDSSFSHRYNQIGTIDVQHDTFHRTITASVWKCIAGIFVKHQAHLHFGIALLHRHHKLPPGCAMVHSQESPDEDTCRIEEIGQRELFPTAYHLYNNHFLPYEFSSTWAASPTDEFLSDLGAFLQQSSLGNVIAITKVSPTTLPWVERQSSDKKGTIATRLVEAELRRQGYITTEWVLRQGETGIEALPFKGCDDKSPVGGHKTT